MTTIADVEKAIAALGYGTVDYHEAMAFYLMTMARAQWRQADLARKRERADCVVGEDGVICTRTEPHHRRRWHGGRTTGAIVPWGPLS